MEKRNSTVRPGYAVTTILKDAEIRPLEKSINMAVRHCVFEHVQASTILS